MEEVVRTDNLRENLALLTKPVSELEEGMLISATYDGDLRVAVLKFYEPKTGQMRLWRDNTGHKPYCYTKLERQELDAVGRRNDVLRIEEAEKADLLSDSMIKVRKIVATDPLAIGGRQNSVRDQIRAWEADIKYFENYAYDNGLRMGTYYRISGGKVLPLKLDAPELVAKSLEEIFRRNPHEFGPYLREWAELLGQPLPDFKRITLDIEVANEENRVPDSDTADLPVIAVSFFNEYEKVVYLLERENRETVDLSNAEYKTVLFNDEQTLLRAALGKMMEYPVVVTFNGDDFDLRYLKHRAERREIGIREEENPITLERVAATLKHGIHIDLYQFFRNRSIQVYAFSNKYTEHTLNGIAEVLLGKSKIEFDGNVGDLPLLDLANYCFKDAELTYELTSMSDSVVMKLLVVLARIGKMPMNDVSRLGVSNWIRSMLFYEHRKINALIPRQDELSQKGGASSQAIIKGKKYKGGLVIEPKPGVYFDVSVLDFASLYPSLIKVQNLSYETVNCPHEECRRNIVPETTHWVCTKRKGVTSLVTGSLRDLRVSHYKPLSKIPTLSKEERDLYGIVSQGLKVILNACFSGDTELVTPEGIKNIKDFKVGDRVVSVNPESLEPEIDEVVDVQAFDYNGDLYHFKDKRFVDLLVTPNHRFLTVDRRGGSRTGVAFRTAEEVYNGTNVTIPKLKSPPVSWASPQISMLKTARALNADVHLFPNGRRLSSWFRTLEPELRSKIRSVGTVHKQRSKVNEGWGSHYTLSSSEISEEDLDEVERAGGFALVSEKRSSKVPVRFDGEKFAALCGWFVSEGSLYSTAPREYPTGVRRGRSEGVLISQSYGRGNPRGLVYRGKIAGLLSGLGLRGRTDSEERKYFKVASGILHEWTRTNCYSEDVGSHRASSKRIPQFVFTSVQTMRAFLESAYMGDGSAKQVCYSTTSESLAKDMVVLLSLLGAKSKIKWDNGIYRLTFKNVSTKLTHSGNQIHKYVTRFPYEGKVYCVTTARNHTVMAGRNGRFVQVGQSYGVMGFETFAFYCLPVAEATAAFGRDAITKTIEQCSSLDINVIYSDTDSLFLHSPTTEQVSTVTRWAEKELGIELDLDKNYRYIAFSSRKKNYFGVLPDGTPDIKGLTGKKSQTPEFLKKTFYDTLDILSRVQTSADFERARGSIRELLTTMILRLRNRSMPIDELAFNVMIGKPTRGYSENTPQHVKAAQLLEKTGREIKAGDIIAYVKTRTPPFVKPASLAKADEIDEEKYIDYAHSMFDQMLDALDFSFDEIMGATTLDLFWS